MRLQATIRLPDGTEQPLDQPILANPTQTKGEIVGKLKAQGYEVTNLVTLGDLPEAAPSQGILERVTRALPATAGMIRGGTLGGELGSMAGPFGTAAGAVAGAGLGAAGAEGLYAGAQRLFGMKGGEQPIVARMVGAGESGALGEAGIRGAGAVGRGIFGALRPTAKVAAETGFGGVRDAAITSELMKQLEARGGAKDAVTFARQIRSPLRAMLRETERAFNAGTAAQKQALEPTLNSLRQLGVRTLSLAPLAQAISKDPVLLADLVRKQGPAILPELQAAWLTAAIGHATGKAGLSRGLLNVGELQNLYGALGEEGQRTLFSRTGPALQRLFQTIQETGGLPGGEVTKDASKEAASNFPKVVHYLLRSGGGAFGIESVMHGHPVTGAMYAAMPWILGRLMQNEAGVDWLTRTAVAMRDARMFTQVAPALAREGVQLLGGTGSDQSPPPRARLGPQMVPTP